MGDEMERECKTCKLVKSLEEFNKGNAKYGRKSECKVCQGKRASEYKRRPEVIKRGNEWQRNKYNSLTEEERKEIYRNKKSYFKEWCDSNRDKLKATRRAYYERTREAAIRRAIKWNENNPDKARSFRKVSSSKRRFRLKGGPKLTAHDIKILEAYNHSTFKNEKHLTCEYCRTIISGVYHLEHIHPVSKGGLNVLSNLAISCKECNCGVGGKHSKTLEEFRPDLIDYFKERILYDGKPGGPQR